MSVVTHDALVAVAKRARLRFDDSSTQAMIVDMENIMWLVSKLDGVQGDDIWTSAVFPHISHASMLRADVSQDADDMLGVIAHPTHDRTLRVDTSFGE